jgi:hypothetical protein
MLSQGFSIAEQKVKYLYIYLFKKLTFCSAREIWLCAIGTVNAFGG